MGSFSYFSRNWSGGTKAEILAWFVFLTDEIPNQMCQEARAAVLAPKVCEGVSQSRSTETHPVHFPGAAANSPSRDVPPKGKGHNGVWDADTALACS